VVVGVPRGRAGPSSTTAQFLAAEAGYAVLLPNVRGSHGTARPSRDGRLPAARVVPRRHRIRPESLFVIQGKNDPRVPQSESEQIVNAVRAKGKDVWYLLGLDEGHGFQKKEARDAMTAALAWFLSRALGSSDKL
jgi:dipeptidyl aminopeptidase/acylaminoacyl peptidase